MDRYLRALEDLRVADAGTVAHHLGVTREAARVALHRRARAGLIEGPYKVRTVPLAGGIRIIFAPLYDPFAI